eukprot:CAMPEP_0178426304 /NCGR_PEP_ID=MMETSP0689_2-20121128/29167_1 /TAXON_ID=160604 /ORGANISM="Amphidinium massartii, Strain CS-259" /LENGTH=120 /DNA_ID=CAMNT_0020047989 /DNA_START=818 /DNA_END=1180 /DNA_ORIENTATION=-
MARGTGTWVEFAISPASSKKSLKGESSTHAASVGSFDALKMAVAAPMERPHKAMAVARPDSRKYSITTLASFCSWYPNEQYSPPDRPEPEKSKAHRDKPRLTVASKMLQASHLLEPSPCK